jgi:hypothetical protein
MVLFLGTDVINKKSPQDNLVSCFYNHNELDLRNGFFREEEVCLSPVQVHHQNARNMFANISMISYQQSWLYSWFLRTPLQQ